MAREVRRKGRDPLDTLYVLETDSTGTSALVVTAAAYVPGREAGDYDPRALAQIDTDEIEDAPAPVVLWAVCAGSDAHGLRRVSPWMERSDADTELEALSRRGFAGLFLESSEGTTE